MQKCFVIFPIVPEKQHCLGEEGDENEVRRKKRLSVPGLLASIVDTQLQQGISTNSYCGLYSLLFTNQINVLNT